MQLTIHGVYMQAFSSHAILFSTAYKHGISGNQHERFAIHDCKHETSVYRTPLPAVYKLRKFASHPEEVGQLSRDILRPMILRYFLSASKRPHD